MKISLKSLKAASTKPAPAVDEEAPRVTQAPAFKPLFEKHAVLNPAEGTLEVTETRVTEVNRQLNKLKQPISVKCVGTSRYTTRYAFSDNESLRDKIIENEGYKLVGGEYVSDQPEFTFEVEQ